MGFLKHLVPCANDCSGCNTSPCDSCCPSISSVQCRTQSASKTKCGHSEWPGYESTPPRIYRTLTLSGTLTAQTYPFADCSGTCDAKFTWAFSGTCVYNSDCTTTDTGSRTYTEYADCITPGTPVVDAFCDLSAAAAWTETYSSTVHTLAGLGCDGAHTITSGSATATLSNEYTTGDLYSDCAAAVIVASWSGYGSCSGVTTLHTVSSDELTVTLRNVDYKVTFSAPVGTGCKLKYDYYENGVIQFTVCVALTPGITEYVVSLGYNGASNWTTHATNFVMATAC